MLQKKPAVSIIIPTYNRAHLINNAIQSVLSQTFKDFEIIVVDDGSTDNTLEMLAKYGDQIRIFQHTINRGVCAAKNTGLDHIRGEWFTILDSDDVMKPYALEVFLNVPKTIDPKINAITCNCFDSVTGEFTGKGLDSDQYLPQEKIIKQTVGEFWGLTKTELLGDKRFNEDLPSYEFTLWYQLDAIANRYYIHQGLRIYTTDEKTSVVKAYKASSALEKARVYRTLATTQSSYWEVLRKYHSSRLVQQCLKGIFFLRIGQDEEGVSLYRNILKINAPGYLPNLLSFLILIIHPKVLSMIYKSLR